MAYHCGICTAQRQKAAPPSAGWEAGTEALGKFPGYCLKQARLAAQAREMKPPELQGTDIEGKAEGVAACLASLKSAAALLSWLPLLVIYMVDLLRLGYGLTSEEVKMLRCSEDELRCKLADVPPATAGGLAAVLKAAFVGLQQVATDYGDKRELAMHRARKRNDEQQRLRSGPAGPPPRAYQPGSSSQGPMGLAPAAQGGTTAGVPLLEWQSLRAGAPWGEVQVQPPPRARGVYAVVAAGKRQPALRCERPLRHGWASSEAAPAQVAEPVHAHSRSSPGAGRAGGRAGHA